MHKHREQNSGCHKGGGWEDGELGEKTSENVLNK